MREALIVSTARTPIGKAYRGAFNATTAQTLAGHAIHHAVSRSKVDPAEISDCIIGAALQQGSTASNIARQAAIRAGLPVTVAGIRNAHLNYAITWFLLAVSWLGMTGYWLWRISRRLD